MKKAKIKRIEIKDVKIPVYNLELVSKRPDDKDDLFFVANGIVTHNCFPKDLNALIHHAKELGVDPKMMKATWEKNLEVRPSVQRDWEKMAKAFVKKEK